MSSGAEAEATAAAADSEDPPAPAAGDDEVSDDEVAAGDATVTAGGSAAAEGDDDLPTTTQDLFGGDSDDSDDDDAAAPAKGGVDLDSGSDSDAGVARPKKKKRRSAGGGGGGSSGGDGSRRKRRGSGAGAGAGAGQASGAGEGVPDDAVSVDSAEMVATQEDHDFVDREGQDADMLAELDREQHFDESQEAMEDDDDDLFDRVLKTGGSRRAIKLTEAQIEHQVNHLFQTMDAAAASDRKARKSGKPAIAKLQKLQEVDRAMRNQDLFAPMLDQGLLQHLDRWLRPPGKGSLPSLRIRTTLFPRLLTMPIETNHLKASNVGKIAMALYNHPSETPQNKKVLRALIEKWSRLIFAKASSFTNYSSQVGDRGARRTPRGAGAGFNVGAASSGRSLADAISGRKADTDESKQEQRFSLHARVPVQATFDFVRAPRSKVSGEAERSRGQTLSSESNAARKSLKRKLQEMRRPVRKNVRAVKMSIEGRGV